MEETSVMLPVDTLAALETQVALFILKKQTKELMGTRFCNLETWRTGRMEALMLMIRVGVAIARRNEDLCRKTLNLMQSDSRWTEPNGEIANACERPYGGLQMT